MRLSPQRIVAAAAFFALAAAGAGCGTADEDADRDMMPGTVEPSTAAVDGTAASESTRGSVKTGSQREFLDDLAAIGLPTEMTAATTVEVGIGLCESIADGADTETILDQIRPFTSAIAAQDLDLDSSGVGRAILDASRTHLCG